jgi:uncharacterized protein involved in exopolysaccharide biosynthesis
MMNTRQQVEVDKDQISLGEAFSILLEKKWQILATTIAFTLAAALAAWLLPKSYKAAVLLSPVSNTGSNQLGAMGSLVSQLGQFASLAGVPAGGDSKKSESIAVLQSEALTEKYIAGNNLLPVLFEWKWDAETGKWKTNDPKRIPTLWKANELFKKQVRFVGNDTKTGLVMLTITWKDPHTAAKWANDLVAMTNDYLRGRAIDESDRNIAFLNDQALKNNVVEVRQAIYKILESEISKGMMARGSKEYAFKILDPAVPPDKPTSPDPVIWIPAGLFGGLLLSSAVVLLRSGPRLKATK